MEQAVAEATPAPVTIVETPKPSFEDTMASVYDKMNPDTRVDRSENGQFKSKNPEIKAEGAETGDPAETEIIQEPAAETKETAPPSIPRPQSWKSEYETAWAKLSPDEQKTIADWEGERHKQFTRLGEVAKKAEQYDALFDRFRHVLNGTAPEREIESLLSTKAALLQNPAGSIQWLAQQLGVNLSQLVQQPGAENIPADPQLGALQQQFMQLQRQLGELHQNITARDQQEIQRREQSLASQIEKFSEGKDYWSEIEDEVHTQILGIGTKDAARAVNDPIGLLKEAEQRAIKLTPSVQEKLDKAAKAEAEKKAQAEAKKKADEAKKLASLNVRSTTGANPKAAPKSIEAQMEEVYDKMAARG